MKVYILESGDWKNSLINKKELLNLVEGYANEAEMVLNNLSKNLNIIVKPNLPHVSTTKGVGGSTYDHELIDITFNPSLPFGMEKFKKYLKEAIFHEMNHAVYMKFNPREDRQLYWTIMEGLGVVFDREFADGEHFAEGESTEKHKVAWLRKYNSNSINYWETPNDGMMYQVGAWIVVRARENSGKDIAELTQLSCDEVLEFSKVK